MKILKTVKFITREQWGAKPPIRVIKNTHLPTDITIHHASEDISDKIKRMYAFNGVKTMREIQKYHQENLQQNDLGFHLLIDYEGNVYQGRDLEKNGIHVKMNNTDNIGIVLYGNFEVESPSPQMVLALQKTIIELSILYPHMKIPQNIKAHSEYGTIGCPGIHVVELINAWKYGDKSIFNLEMENEHEIW